MGYLSYVEQQAQTEAALADPNDIQPGTKVKLYNDCVFYSPNEPSYAPNPTNPNAKPTLSYFRDVAFQNYEGTDGSMHHFVQVDYTTNSQAKPLSVHDCQPSPACYSYVIGAPTHPSQEPYYYSFPN